MIPLATYLKGSNWMKNIINQKFGKLLVLEFHSKSLAKRPKNKWKCLCDCGKVKIIQENHLISGTTKSCGCLHKRTGKNSPFFKGYEDISLDFFNHIKAACEKPQKYRKSREFKLTIEYLWDLYIKQNKKCAISGVEILFTEREGSRGRRCSASLDRIDSSIGYVEGNVQWVHKIVNIMKNKTDMKEFISWCNKITKHNENRPQ
jgi:hypothetical protein